MSFDFPPPENRLNPMHFNKGSLIEYVVGALRKAKNLVPPEYDIRDSDLKGIVYSCYGLRCWLETDRGSLWLYRLTGIEELQPHVGYNYWLVSPHADGPPVRMPLTPSSGVASLAIYTVNPVDRSTEVPKAAVTAVRDKLYEQGLSMSEMPQTNFIDFVVRHARDWFCSSGGYQWCAGQTGYLTRLKVFAALNLYGLRAYRVTKQNADPFWVGPHVESLQQVQWIEHAPKTARLCDQCEQEFPCTQAMRQEALCCHCLAQTSQEATSVLDFCAYEECKLHGPCKNSMSIAQVRGMQQRWHDSLDVSYGR